eukprot:1882307-Amphidinium_carterae.1
MRLAHADCMQAALSQAHLTEFLHASTCPVVGLSLVPARVLGLDPMQLDMQAKLQSLNKNFTVAWRSRVLSCAVL